MDQHIQNIKLEGLFDISKISHLAMQNDGQSGFSNYAQGLYLEEKEQYHDSYQKYYQGFYLYADPLCAYRLGEIFSNQQSSNKFKQQKDKWKSYNFLISSLTVDLYYRGIELNSRQIVQSIMDEEKQNSIQLNSQWDHYQIIVDFAQYACEFISYKQLIDSYANKQKNLVSLYQLVLLIVTRLDTQDKLLDQIVSYLNNKNYLSAMNDVALQISDTIKCLSYFKQDSAMFEKIREALFELTFIVKDFMEIKINPLKFDKIPDYIRISHLCGNLWNNIISAIKLLLDELGIINKAIHQSIIIRLNAKVVANGNPYQNCKPSIKEALEIQKKEIELKKSSQYHYAIAYYKIGKLEYKLDNRTQTNLQKAYDLFKKRLELQDNDKFQLILIYYYLSKLSFKLKKIDEAEKYLQDALNLINTDRTLQLVRTLQYHVFKKNIQAYKPILDHQKQSKQSKNIQEKQEQMNLLEQQRQMVIQMKEQQSKISCNSNQNTPIKIKQQEQSIQGPLVVNMLATSQLHAETAISQYVSSSKKPTQDELKNSIERKIQNLIEKDGLYFVRPKDIEHSQFVQKGSFGGGFYKVIIQGKKFGMKTLACISKLDIDMIMENYKEISNYSHPHLRRTLAFMIEELSFQALNLSLIYEYAQRNLYSISGNDQDRLQVALDIIGAIIYLHDKNTIHGNIKPSNILVSTITNQMYGYVCDWELVSRLYPILGNQKQNYWISGQQYHAPELKGNSQNITKQSDIWSLGLIFLLVFFDVDLNRYQLHLDEGLNISLSDIKKESNQQRLEILEIIKQMLQIEPRKRMSLMEIQEKLQRYQKKNS